MKVYNYSDEWLIIWCGLHVTINFFFLVNFQPPQKMVPRTIENTREADETVCRPDDEEVY
jgi:mRNA degradation ribonuclease J1/J2